MAEDLGSIKYSIIADTNDLSKAEAEMDAFGNSAKKSAKDVDKLGADATKTSKSVNSSTSSMSKGMGGFSSAVTVATRALAAMGVALGAREIIQYADAWQNATNQLKTVQKEGESLAATQDKLMATANASRSGFESTATLYARLTRSTHGLNLSQQETIALTDTINKSFAVSGATAQEASNAITQLSQGLAAGALRGEEFNSVSEQSPILMQAIADSIKMTRGELREFAAEGGITAEIVVTALQQASGQIDETFSKMTATFGQNMEVAGNNLLSFIGNAESVKSATGAAGSAIVALTENIGALGQAVGLVATIVGTRMLASFAAATAQSIAYQGALARMAGLSVTAAAAQTSLAVATTVANRAFMAMGGPIGAALIAAAGVYKLTEYMIDLRAESYRLAGDAIAKQALDIMGVSAEEAGTNISAAKDKLSSLKAELESATEIYGENSAEVAEVNKQLDLQYNWLNINKLKLAELNEETEKATRAGVEFTEKTLNLVDSLENQMKALHMTEREQEVFAAGLKALANGDGPDAIRTIKRLTGEYYDAKTELDQWNDSIAEYLKEQKKAKEETEKKAKSVAETIKQLEHEQLALGMTARAQAIFNAVTQAAADKALPDEIARIAELTAVNYDLAESSGAAGKAAADAAKQSQENWQRTHEYMSGALVDLMDNGGNAWDNIAKGFESMVKRMVAEWAASGLMGMFSGQGLGGFTADAFKLATGSGGGGGVGLGNLSSMAGMAGTASQFMGGMFGSSAAAGSASFVGPMAPGLTAGGMGSSVAAFATNPVTLAVAALAIAAKNDFWKDPDDYTRSYAGFLTAPTAGAAGSTFGVDAFASGFRAQGIAHNTDQTTANQYIDTFRSMDASIVELVRQLGGNVDASGATFAGVGKEGQLGTAGTFLGMGGKTTEQDIAGMVNLYVSQLTNSITGIDEDLLSAVKSASSAEDAVRLLSEAMEDEEVELTNMEKARQSASQQILNAYESGITELDSIERAYAAFQGAAKRGLTAAMIAQSTGIMQSEIQRVLDAGAALSTASTPSAAKSVFGADQWAETARQAWQPDAAFKAALNAVGINTNTGSEINGSHANGLSRVPFDGYIAELHEGERVLTKDEASSTNGGSMMLEMLVRRMLSITERWDFDGLPATRGTV